MLLKRKRLVLARTKITKIIMMVKTTMMPKMVKRRDGVARSMNKSATLLVVNVNKRPWPLSSLWSLFGKPITTTRMLLLLPPPQNQPRITATRTPTPKLVLFLHLHLSLSTISAR